MAGNHPGAPPTGGPPPGDAQFSSLTLEQQQRLLQELHQAPSTQQQQHLQPPPPSFYNVFDGQPVLQPAAYAPAYHTLSHPISAEQLHQQYADLDDSTQTLGAAGSSTKSRRRTSSSGDHVKHRRTRSGCFTCRTRRVKCDEARPICERCRRGNRECTYPDPATTTKGGKSSRKASSAQNDSASSDDDEDHPSKGHLPSIPDEDAEENPDVSAPPSSALSSGQTERESSGTPSLTHQSPTPSTDESTSGMLTQPPLITPAKRSPGPKSTPARRSGAPIITSEMQYYLDYHRTRISHYHYLLKYEGGTFLKTTFHDIARSSEPLLHAVVGFAAYHSTVNKQSGGKISDFLKYYNKSVSLLRVSLQRGQRHTLATLLTILQLAAMEEYLGDWVNLLSHQRAAFEILTELYSPEAVANDPQLRIVFRWYVHFDVTAGILAGHGTFLPMEWYETVYRVSLQESQADPGNLERKYSERSAWCQLVAAETAVVFAKRGKGTLNDDDFAMHCDRIEQMLMDWDNDHKTSLLRDPASFITDFSGAPPRDPEDLFDPYDQQFLYGGDHWGTNNAELDLWACQLLFFYQRALAQQQFPPQEVTEIAYKMCKMFNAIQHYPRSEPGVVLSAHASLGIALLFIPKDHRHTTWSRKKLAQVESHGYIFPLTFRQRMADLWQEDVLHWWLPNEEGFPPIIKAIRHFIKERTLPPRDQTSADMRDMKGIFSALDALSLDDRTASSSASPEHDFGSAIFTPDSTTGSHHSFGWGGGDPSQYG